MYEKHAKFISIVGTRPNLIKLDPKLKNHKIIYTGQHYDEDMKDVFFTGLKIPKPTWDLCKTDIGEIIDECINILKVEKPEYVLIYGDTRSSLAGAIAAHQCNIKIIHVEAGCRSYNQNMIEERNRVLIDRMSTIHLVPSNTEKINLANEGILDNVYVVGCTQFSTMRSLFPTSRPYEIPYYVATIHRAENLENVYHFKKLMKLLALCKNTVYFPVHPHTMEKMAQWKMVGKRRAGVPDNVVLIPPLPYKEMVNLLGYARAVITDSGGLQAEAYFLHTPCITLREETEWKDTVDEEMNVLVGNDSDKFKKALAHFSTGKRIPRFAYGNGRAHELIRAILKSL